MRILVLLVVTAVGCGATNEGIRFGAVPTLAPPGPDAPEHASTPEIGLSTLITDSISELALDDAQRTKLQALLGDIKEKHKSALGARATLAIDMARTVESGMVDDRLLTLDAKNLGEQRAALAADDGRALETLHELLRPEQRKKFSAGLVAKAQTVRLDDFASRYGVWRNDVKTTPEQDARIEPKLKADVKSAEGAKAEREAWQQRLRTTAAAFEGATFSATPFVDPDTSGTTVARIARLIAFLQIVIPELQQDQLERAAKFIRAEAGVSVK